MGYSGAMQKPASRFKVFIADDSGLVREKLRALFSALSTVEICGEAANATEAIAAIRASAADAVILDLDLNESSGLDVLTAIKQSSPATLVIILTIHPFRDLGLYYLNAGADHYFEKGRDFDEVLTLLENLSEQQLPSSR